MAESIKQKPSALGAPGLPDFRNLGVMLRVLLAVNLFAALTVAMRLDAPGRLVEELALMAGRVELPLLLCVVCTTVMPPSAWPAPFCACSASETNRSTCACKKRLVPNWRIGCSMALKPRRWP